MSDGYGSPEFLLPSALAVEDDVTTRRGTGTEQVLNNPYKKRAQPVPVSGVGTKSRSLTLDRLDHARFNGERLFSPKQKTTNVHHQTVALSNDTSDISISLSPKSVMEEQEEDDDPRLPRTMSAMHKYYALLLRNSITELLQAAPGGKHDSDAEEAGEELLAKMCDIAKLPTPVRRLKAKYDTPREHMQSRAALVLEEGRYTLCQDLYNLRLTKMNPAFTIEMKLDSRAKEEEPDTPNSDAKKKADTPTVFRSATYDKGWFTPDVMARLIPGLILQCTSNDGTTELLGVVSSSNNQSVMAKHGVFEILFYDPSLALPPGSRWAFCPVGSSHINSAREFAAVMEYENLVPFFDVVRGVHAPAEQRLAESSRKGDANGGKTDENKTDPCATPPQFQFPILNRSQEAASSIFLDSPKGSVTIVQGMYSLCHSLDSPPGTGKTTFCVGVICKYLLGSLPGERRHRILVCAPTNKAISHIAKRFLAAIRGDDNQYLNVIALGNVDKLGVDSDSRPFPLNITSIHLYSWVKAVLDEYTSLRFESKSMKFESKHQHPVDPVDVQIKLHRLDLLRKRLRSSLGALPPELEKAIDSVHDVLEKNQTNPDTLSFDAKIESVIQTILGMDQSQMRKSLVNSASVIFSTLSAARSSAAMTTEAIDCLIVDEAAAATEPALYIPFHLQPKKMLLVGDPKQLPAIVTSPIAERYGLSESFHERLMERLRCREFQMLDTQYRMKPDISLFPSCAFYNGMLKNGGNVLAQDYGVGTSTILDGRPYIFLQVEGEAEVSVVSKSSYNRKEADVVVQLLNEMRNRFVGCPWESEDYLRVITFYKEQASLIHSHLKRAGFQKVSVGTVDSTQGCEADLVILSFVKGSESAGFLKDDRRINVALTRARHQLICVGNVQAMGYLEERDASTLQWMSFDAHERGVVATT
eukprot:scaffold3571_cov176-Amphora_coffeaeformis.AAC.17